MGNVTRVLICPGSGAPGLDNMIAFDLRSRQIVNDFVECGCSSNLAAKRDNVQLKLATVLDG